MAKVGFIGAGLMGAPMIGHLAAAGHDVVAWNRTAARLDGLPVRVAKTPREAAEGCAAVHLSVIDTAAVENVLTGPDGVLEASGGLIVDHSTIAADATRTLAERAATRGFQFVDMPVSGGRAGAEAGTLTVFAGGTDQDVALASRTAGAFAGRITHMGPVGAGQATKAANQLIVGGIFILLAEAANLATRNGVDAARLPDAMAGGFADSTLLQRQLPRMVAGPSDLHGTAATMLKDLDLVAAAAAASGAATPLAQASQALWQRHAKVHPQADWVSILQTIRAMAPGEPA